VGRVSIPRCPLTSERCDQNNPPCRVDETGSGLRNGSHRSVFLAVALRYSTTPPPVSQLELLEIVTEHAARRLCAFLASRDARSEGEPMTERPGQENASGANLKSYRERSRLGSGSLARRRTKTPSK
jgi:hypothetical protein